MVCLERLPAPAARLWRGLPRAFARVAAPAQARRHAVRHLYAELMKVTVQPLLPVRVEGEDVPSQPFRGDRLDRLRVVPAGGVDFPPAGLRGQAAHVEDGRDGT